MPGRVPRIAPDPTPTSGSPRSPRRVGEADVYMLAAPVAVLGLDDGRWPEAGVTPNPAAHDLGHRRVSLPHLRGVPWRA